MRPDPSRVLGGVAQTLAAQLARETKTPFGAYLATIAAGLTGTMAVEIERIADRLYRENKALLALLTEAALLAGESLRTQIQAAASLADPPNLLVSTLVAANDRLRFLLIEVHSDIESQTSEAARSVDQRIWDELRESTRRRHVGIGAY